MDIKILLVIIALVLVGGGALSLNDSLNTSFIKWSNEGRGVKTEITPATLKRSKSLGYFLIAIGLVFAVAAFVF